MVRIKDQDTVEELYRFYHPKYSDQQDLFFDSKLELMIEWLSHGRVNLYEKMDTGKVADSETMNIRWKRIRRMERLNVNYGRMDFLERVSPDFRYFVDVDRSKHQFLIIEMMSEEIRIRIPLYLMTYKNDPDEAMSRFMWVGNDAMKIVNDEGIEKIIDLNSDTCDQLGFNKI